MNNTITQKILWTSTGMALISVLVVAIESFADKNKQESKVQKVEAVPGEKDTDWPSLFTNATNLASKKEFAQFTAQFKSNLARDEKTVQEDIISLLTPSDTEDNNPELPLMYFKNAYRALQNMDLWEMNQPEIAWKLEFIQSKTLTNIADLYMWKMFFYRLKHAAGGERAIVLDDQKKWMAWRKEHSQLIFDSVDKSRHNDFSWLLSIARSELGNDRLNELLCFGDSCTEIYRDLKFASVRCKGKSVKLRHGRLYFEKDDKKMIGRIMNPAFCRRMVSGKDIYKFAILEPDYIVSKGYNSDGFCWACVWKNGCNTANYKLPIEKEVMHLPLFSEERKITSGIQAINVTNTVITIIPSKDGRPIVIDARAVNNTCLDLEPKY